MREILFKGKKKDNGEECMLGCLWKILELLSCRRELKTEILNLWRYKRDKSRNNQVPWTVAYKYPV